MAALATRMHGLRQELRRRRLAREERAALRRLGRHVALELKSAPGTLDRLADEIGCRLREIETMSEEARACVEADRIDLARVAPWMRPAVVIRGVCGRGVIRHRRRSVMRALEQSYEALGREMVRRGGTSAPDDMLIHAALDPAAANREQPAEPSGDDALPAWTSGVAREVMKFGRAVVRQLHCHLLPKAPAIAGMLVGWWIANTYTDSHVRSMLHSVGIGSGGTRVVSGSAYRAMNFWLPLLAAAACAYMGERLARWWWGEGTSPGRVEPRASGTGGE